jgi:uncharacterized membrane protein HdeD (DUF308 family)
MSLSRSNLLRISTVLYLRGFLLLGCAAVAVRWPQDTLREAMVTAGGVVGVLGLFELIVAAAARVVRDTKTLMLTHAALSMSFGVVAITALTASADTTMRMVAVWLLLHAIVALGLASRMSTTLGARRALAAWSAVNLLCAFVVVTFPTIPPAGLLYLGAGYAAVYAIIQIGVALWIKRGLLTLAANV